MNENRILFKNRLTVQNIIDELNKIEDKEMFVVVKDPGELSGFYFVDEVKTKILHDDEEEIKDVLHLEFEV